MPVALRNLSARSLFIPLNSGTNLRLSPGEVAQQIPDVELKDNSKIEKLLSQRAIAVTKQKEQKDSDKHTGSEDKSAPGGSSETDGDDDSEKPRAKERRANR